MPKFNLTQFKSKRYWIPFVIGLIILGSVYAWWFLNKETTDSTDNTTIQAKVKRSDIVVGFDSDGKIAFSKVSLRFGVSGNLSEIFFKKGHQVKQGDIIARLDDQNYQDQYKLALAKMKSAQEQEYSNILSKELTIKKSAAQLENLRSQLKEMEMTPDAYSAHEIKMQTLDLENSELEFKHLQENYAVILNNYNNTTDLDQNELSVKMAQENLADTVLTAPVLGQILDLSKKVGERISDEQDFAIIHENNQVKAVTNVIEYDITNIKVGQKVYIKADALEDAKFIGFVSNIEALPTSDSSGLVNYTVEIDLTDPSSNLKDGMTCTVSIVQKEILNCLNVPYPAIHITDGQQMVTVQDANGNLTEKTIKAGFSDGTTVEILEGLNVNETLVYQKSR